MEDVRVSIYLLAYSCIHRLVSRSTIGPPCVQGLRCSCPVRWTDAPRSLLLCLRLCRLGKFPSRTGLFLDHRGRHDCRCNGDICFSTDRSFPCAVSNKPTTQTAHRTPLGPSDRCLCHPLGKEAGQQGKLKLLLSRAAATAVSSAARFVALLPPAHDKEDHRPGHQSESDDGLKGRAH